MLKMSRKRDFNHLPYPRPSPSWCAREVGVIAAHLLTQQRARQWQIQYMLPMLDENYLMSLPKLQKDTTKAFYFDWSPKNLWWLWYSWGSELLGWNTKRLEGHEHGFSPEVYNALREIVFPFPKVEHVDNEIRENASQVVREDQQQVPRCRQSTTGTMWRTDGRPHYRSSRSMSGATQ